MANRGVEICIGERIICCYGPTDYGLYGDCARNVKRRGKRLQIAHMEQLAIFLRELYCSKRDERKLKRIKSNLENNRWPFFTSTLITFVPKNDEIGHPAGVFGIDTDLDEPFLEVETIWEQVNHKKSTDERGLRTSPDERIRFAQYGTEWYRIGKLKDRNEFVNNSVARAFAKDLGIECLAQIVEEQKLTPDVSGLNVEEFSEHPELNRDDWISHIDVGYSGLSVGCHSNTLLPYVRALPVYEKS